MLDLRYLQLVVHFSLTDRWCVSVSLEKIQLNKNIIITNVRRMVFNPEHKNVFTTVSRSIDI